MFILAAAAWPPLAWSGAVFAQSKQPIVIGWLSMSSREVGAGSLAAFRDGLAALGWKEGQQFVIEERWADGRIERLPSLAEELSYAADSGAQYRRAAYFVDRILKGAKSADLPFEQPTKIELVVNMKTAKALGLTIPPSILVRADRVIE